MERKELEVGMMLGRKDRTVRRCFSLVFEKLTSGIGSIPMGWYGEFCGFTVWSSNSSLRSHCIAFDKRNIISWDKNLWGWGCFHWRQYAVAKSGWWCWCFNSWFLSMNTRPVTPERPPKCPKTCVGESAIFLFVSPTTVHIAEHNARA